MGDNRPSAYREGKKSIYRVSASGKCVTALVASILGYEPDRAAWAENILVEAAAEGNLHEPDILRRLRDDERMRVWGGQDEDGQDQDEMNWEILPNIVLRGHPDGFAKLPRGRIEHLVEAKTMSKNRFKSWTAYPDFETALLSPEFQGYGWQISGYMHNYNMPAVYAVKNRDSGEMMWQVVKLPVVNLKQIKKKLLTVEKWRLKKELPPCIGDSGERTFCEFPYLHEGEFGAEDEDEYTDPVDDVTEAHLRGLLERHSDLTAVMQTGKRAEEERKDINRTIKSEMTGKKLVLPPYTVSKVKGRTGKSLSHTELFLKLREAIIDNGGGKVPAGTLDWLTPDRLKGLIEESSSAREYEYIKVTKKDG